MNAHEGGVFIYNIWVDTSITSVVPIIALYLSRPHQLEVEEFQNLCLILDPTLQARGLRNGS